MKFDMHNQQQLIETVASHTSSIMIDPQGEILGMTGKNTPETLSSLINDRQLLVHLSKNQLPWTSTTGNIFQPAVYQSDTDDSVTIIFTDITHARYDSLTGLLNRAAMEEMVDELDADPRQSVTVFFVDLDDFKPINDSLGHQAGDELLKTTANLVSDTLRRSGDKLFRYGGDELVGIARGMTVDAATDFFARLEEARTQLNQERQTIGLPIIKFSIRSAVREEMAEHSLRDTIKKADLEMYIAKREKKGAANIFNDGGGI